MEDIECAGSRQIVGAMSHMCIDATTRAAYDLGLKCTLIHDACATRDLAFGGQTVGAQQVHASFMAALGWWYAELQSTAELLRAAKAGSRSAE
jgi:nicotinamidase-related amidase